MSGNDEMFDYVEIVDCFREAEKSKWKKITVDEYVKLIEQHKETIDKDGLLNSKTSLFEIIERDCIPYFDIEKIPTSKGTDYINKIVDNIKNELNKMSNKTFNKYCITYNSNSITHPGLSYHVLFPEYRTLKDEIRKFVNYYVENKFEGYEYIDCSVYSKSRLFRNLYQRGIKNINKTIDEIERNKDYHRILTGSDDIKDYIINNVYNKDSVFFVKVSKIYSHIKNKNAFSGPFLYRDYELIKTICDTIKSTINNSTDKNNENIDVDKQIYNRSLGLIELVDTDKNKYRKILTELIEYYDKNKNYNKFRLPKESINIILDTIQRNIC